MADPPEEPMGATDDDDPNLWDQDPRGVRALAAMLDAEAALERDDEEAAFALIAQASDDITALVMAMPVDHPNTRSRFAMSALLCLELAGDYERRSAFARELLLASPAGSLLSTVREELLCAEQGLLATWPDRETLH